MYDLKRTSLLAIMKNKNKQNKTKTMKKSILAGAVALIIAGSAIAQPVSDRAVIPIGVTLVQILRIHVINGGNIEFVFNDINDYKVGIANGGTTFYDSQVVIASSTDWVLPDIICSKIISIDSFVILPWLRNSNDLIISSDFNKLASKSRLSRFVIVEQSIDATKLGELFLSVQIFSNNSKYSESKICSAS